MKSRDYHRSDILTVQVNPAWEFPDGETFPIMIIQNDAGEIPCDAVTAVRLAPSRNERNKGCSMIGGFAGLTRGNSRAIWEGCLWNKLRL